MALDKKGAVQQLAGRRREMEGILVRVPTAGVNQPISALNALLARDFLVQHLAYTPELGVTLGTLRYREPGTTFLVDFVVKHGELVFGGEPGYLDKMGMAEGLRAMGLSVPT